MIIYGTRAVHCKSALSKTTTCESCGNQGSILLSIYRRHAHVFWIPLFPIGKTGASQCQHCKSAYRSKEMPEPLKREYRHLKTQAKGPIWQFTGIALIAAFILWVNYASAENAKSNSEYISSPVIGDIYNYSTETGSYSTLKVIDISSDSIYISPNEYEINRRSKIYKIDKSENYSEYSFSISKDSLKVMFDSGDIFNIKR